MADGPALCGLDGHDHLHGLDLNIRLPGLDFLAGLLKVADDLTSDIRAKFGGVKDGGHESSDAVDRETETERLVQSKDSVGSATEVGNKGSLGGLPNLDVDLLVVDGETDGVGGGAGDSENVLDVLVSNLDREVVHIVDAGEGGLSLGEAGFDLVLDLVDVVYGLVDSSRGDNKVRRLANRNRLRERERGYVS